MYTSIQKWGNSQAVRLPKAILETLSLKENDKVEIIAERDSIIIKKAARKRRAKVSLEERFEGFEGEYEFVEWDTGKPVGREIW